jgi:ankyrin repeat protein
VSDITRLLQAIGTGDRDAARALLDASPPLATAGLGRDEEFFVEARRAQVYAGDTALHAAAFSYDVATAQDLVARGADVRARNRRGGEPLHAAMVGSPGSDTWDPDRQRTILRYLVEAGADVDARAEGGVTPLHRAVRNRCSAAVETVLALGADPGLRTDGGSTAADLARMTTGRGGTGSAEAKAEQAVIVELLARSS